MSNPTSPNDPTTSRYESSEKLHGARPGTPAFEPTPPPAGTSFRPISPWQKILGFRVLWPLVALLLLLAYNFFFTPGFFKIEVVDGRFFGSLIDVLSNGTIVAILALGMTIVIATGGIDLSVGAVMAIGSAITAMLVIPPTTTPNVVSGQGWNFWASAMVALSVAGMIGAFNGFLVAVVRIQPIIATLIVMVAGRGIAQMVTGPYKPDVKSSETFMALGNGYFLLLPLGVTIVATVFILCAAATRMTGFGLALESVGDSPTAARYVGLRVKLITVCAYIFSAACAAIAGLIDASKISAADPINSGLSMELYAIFAVVVGGTALTGGRFTLIGSIVGALLYQTLNTTLLSTKLMGHDIKPAYLPLPIAVVIIVVSLLQSAKFREAVLRPFTANRRRRTA